MEPITAVIAAIGVLGNVVLAFFGLWQRAKKRTALQQLDTVSEGLIIIEETIEKNKDVIKNLGVGKSITKSIVRHSIGAELFVDEARRLARKRTRRLPLP